MCFNINKRRYDYYRNSDGSSPVVSNAPRLFDNDSRPSQEGVGFSYVTRSPLLSRALNESSLRSSLMIDTKIAEQDIGRSDILFSNDATLAAHLNSHIPAPCNRIDTMQDILEPSLLLSSVDAAIADVAKPKNESETSNSGWSPYCDVHSGNETLDCTMDPIQVPGALEPSFEIKDDLLSGSEHKIPASMHGLSCNAQEQFADVGDASAVQDPIERGTYSAASTNESVNMPAHRLTFHIPSPSTSPPLSPVPPPLPPSPPPPFHYDPLRENSAIIDRKRPPRIRNPRFWKKLTKICNGFPMPTALRPFPILSRHYDGSIHIRHRLTDRLAASTRTSDYVDAIWESQIKRFGDLNPLQDEEQRLIKHSLYAFSHLPRAVACSDIRTKRKVYRLMAQHCRYLELLCDDECAARQDAEHRVHSDLN